MILHFKKINFLYLLLLLCFFTSATYTRIIEGREWEIHMETRGHELLPVLNIHPRCLKGDREQVQGKLDVYFNTSLLATHEKNKDGELDSIRLKYPHALRDLEEFYIDPRIKVALQHVYPPLKLENIPFFWMNHGSYYEMLNDNWTLFAWSRFMASNFEIIKKARKKICIYHLDDHSDMMSPLVYQEGEDLKTIIGNQVLSIHDPSTIQRAIDSGCIPIGAFITVFLYGCLDIPIEVRHLTNRLTYIKGDTPRSISLHTKPDIFFPDKQRIECMTEDVLTEGTMHTYFATSQSEEFLKGFDPTAINFLHLDMDYYNDRYDGDGNWKERPRIFDPAASTEDSINNSFMSLSTYCWDNVTLAYSPGFFPAEFWKNVSQMSHQYFVNFNKKVAV